MTHVQLSGTILGRSRVVGCGRANGVKQSWLQLLVEFGNLIRHFLWHGKHVFILNTLKSI
jgi:hypothetical protein